MLLHDACCSEKYDKYELREFQIIETYVYFYT